jgi:hypothetical protein
MSAASEKPQDGRALLETLRLPLAERWVRQSQAITRSVIGFMVGFARDLGWDVVNEKARMLARLGGYGTGQEAAAWLAERNRSGPAEQRDARDAALAYLYAAANNGSDWNPKILDWEPDLVRLHCTGTCTLLDAARALSQEANVDCHGICTASHGGVVQGATQGIEYQAPKGRCQGDDVCEFVFRNTNKSGPGPHGRLSGGEL